MPIPFSDNPAKRTVREQWDTPILRYLHTRYGFRYRYMGLPGVDLIDVKLWKDMIDEVIAFEPPDNSADRRESITRLRRNMKLLGIPGFAYWGSLEEVVILQQDYDGQLYAQKNVVTLYNLDFCDEIGSSIRTRDAGQKTWRFQAIRQILRDQTECYRKMGGPTHFVVMLTVRNQMNSNKLLGFLNAQLLAEAKAFFDKCNKLNSLPHHNGPLIGSHSWALKTFLFNLLCTNFTNPNFSALLFPLVLYAGTPIVVRNRTIPSPMIHWFILCRFAEHETEAAEIFPTPYLDCSSVTVKKGALLWAAQTGETNYRSQPPNPLEWLTISGDSLLRNFKAN